MEDDLQSNGPEGANRDGLAAVAVIVLAVIFIVVVITQIV